VLTGAGVSTASGIPTFRGTGGLWRTHRAEDLATPGAFIRQPALVWEWYDSRRQIAASCRPNAAHLTLAGWSRTCSGFTLITQNVDGLHERAGTRDVIRFHGSIWDIRCWNGCGGARSQWTELTTPLSVIPPRCPDCGGLGRPAVVWFGEEISDDVMTRSLAATDCDLFLTVGTSAVVYPAASLLAAAKRRGAFTAEVNVESTPSSSLVDLAIRGPAERILPEVESVRQVLSAGPAE